MPEERIEKLSLEKQWLAERLGEIATAFKNKKDIRHACPPSRDGFSECDVTECAGCWLDCAEEFAEEQKP